MLKLVTKLPEGKDPVICICFEKEFEAQKTNQDLRSKFDHDIYTIRFMPIDMNNMNLMLISDQNQRLYKNIFYDFDKFNWWLNYTKKDSSFSFCHIIEIGDTHKLAKTYLDRKNFVLKASSYALVNEEQMTFFPNG